MALEYKGGFVRTTGKMASQQPNSRKQKLNAAVACEENANTTANEPFALLPDHISVKILRSLPRFARAVASCVCKSWREAINLPICASPSPAKEDWLFISVFDSSSANHDGFVWHEDFKWILLDPISRRYRSLIPPPLLRRFFVAEYGAQAVSIRNDLYILGLGFFDESYDCLAYCDDSREWRSMPLMKSRRCFFACAADSCSNSLFVAGGNDFITSSLKSAERFDVASNSWEELPEMIKSRDLSSGVVLQGRFYVIGGFVHHYHFQNDDQYRYPIAFPLKPLYSGEFYDPATNSWTLVPDMWPIDFNRSLVRPVVAVAKNRLFALKFDSDSVFEYDVLTNQWSLFASVGFRIDSEVHDCRLLGIDQELWLVIRDKHANDVSFLLCNVVRPFVSESGSVSFDKVELDLEKRFSFLQFCATFTV